MAYILYSRKFLWDKIFADSVKTNFRRVKFVRVLTHSSSSYTCVKFLQVKICEDWDESVKTMKILPRKNFPLYGSVYLSRQFLQSKSCGQATQLDCKQPTALAITLNKQRVYRLATH